MEGSKVCRDCKTSKNVSAFYKNTGSKDGLQSKCKDCYEIDRQGRKAKVREENEKRDDLPIEKACRKCKIVKSTSEHFYVDLTQKDGFSYLCKECRSANTTASRNKRCAPKRNQRKIAEEQERKIVGDGKRCATCKQVKDKSEYCDRADQKDGLNYQCRACGKLQHQKGNQKNTEKNKSLVVDPSYKKRCWACKETKLATEFSKRLASPDGLEGQCRPCKKKRKLDYIDRCEDKVANTVFDPTAPKYCNGCIQDKTRADFQACKATPDGLQSRCKWCQNRKSNVSANSGARQRRHYLEQYAPVSEQAIDNMIDKCGHKCTYCRIDVKRGINLHVDHMIPISRGGPHVIENLTAACATCNYKKGAMTDIEFIAYRVRRGLQ